ncbi:hypothetical protein ABW19_dt0206781 [Dactylella cylindrospora]|nr:hypothetical protein ABW19_dt0206781 [Dactylella cylindrospora]
MSATGHPFDPLSAEEISKVVDIVRSDTGDTVLSFRVVTLSEPPKTEILQFLQEGEPRTGTVKVPTRVARAQVYAGNDLFEYLINLDNGEVDSKKLLVGRHSHIDPAYMHQVEAACLADARIQNEIKGLKLPVGAVVMIEPWTYGTDGMNDMSKRITMCWFYMRLSENPDANFYAYPLEICAEVSEDLKVVNIWHLPSGEADQLATNGKPFDQSKIHSSSEYHPDLFNPHRTSTRPYQISQPDGPSFKVTGNILTWEKWGMHVGFNYREGLVLHNIRYDDRTLFYRLSLSEMFVPYGDPRAPYPRKAAFDLGNDGAGVCANNLKLGCDCLGHIKYFDAWHVTTAGIPLKMPNVICCHEVDDGILWKHTNTRTGNAVVARSRILVLQTIITVSNYEYIFLFYFGQDGSIQYEVRATGIVSTVPINIGDNVPFGTVVAPGVLAPYHQHLFCLRIDPFLDGQRNSLLVEETHPMPFTPGSPPNPFGVGFTTKSRYIEEEGGYDLDFKSNRLFKIVNESITNPTTGTPVAFKLVPCYSQLLLAHPDSFHAKRSEFAEHAVWVTRYSDEELYAAGRYTMQSTGGEGIASWIKYRSGRSQSERSVRNEDIVIWHTFGSTHNPRIEDWPIMPCEKMAVGLKPVNFFNCNPGVDVAPSTQETSQSVLVDNVGNCC